MHHVHSVSVQPRRCQIPVAGITGCCESSCGCWEPGPDPLQEQQLPFITEAPLQIFIHSGDKSLLT